MNSTQDLHRIGTEQEGKGDCLLTKKEAARRLSISTRTLDRLAAKGLIEKVFVGGAVRVRASEIVTIIQHGV